MRIWMGLPAFLALPVLTLQSTSFASAAGLSGGGSYITYIAAANSASPADGSVSTTFVVIFGIIAILLALGILLTPLWVVLLIKRKRRKQAAAAVDTVKLHQDNLAVLYQIEQELEPLIKMADGKSEDFLNETEGKYNKLLQMAAADTELLQNYKPGWLKFGDKYKRYEEAKNRIGVIAAEIQDVGAALERYRELEVQVTVKMKELEEGLESAEKQLQETVSMTGYRFEELAQRGREIKDKLAENQDALSFDPLASQAFTEKIGQEFAQLKRNVESLHKLSVEWTQLPGILGETRSEIGNIAERENLKLAEADPYDLLAEAESLLPQIGKRIEGRGIDKGNELLAKALHLRDDALVIVQETAEARKWTADVLRTAKERFIRTDNTYSGLAELLEEVKQEYAAVHWSKYVEQLQTGRGNLSMFSRQTADVEEEIAPEVQHYVSAKGKLGKMIETLDRLDRTSEEISGLKPRLDQEFAEQARKLRDFQDEYNKTVIAIDEEELKPEPRVQKKGIEADRALTAVVKALEVRPRELVAVSTALKHAESALADLSDMFEQVLEEQENAEQRLYDFEESYESIKKSLGWSKSRKYSSSYKEIHEAASSALLEFDYEQVEEHIASGESVIKRMRAEFEREMEELRQQQEMDRRVAEAVQKELKQRHHHHHNQHHHHDT